MSQDFGETFRKKDNGKSNGSFSGNGFIAKQVVRVGHWSDMTRKVFEGAFRDTLKAANDKKKLWYILIVYIIPTDTN